jgi:hypothetical protein
LVEQSPVTFQRIERDDRQIRLRAAANAFTGLSAYVIEREAKRTAQIA